MSIYRMKEVFIGAGGTPTAAPVSVTAGDQLNVITPNGETLDAAEFIVKNPKEISIANKYANGDLKISNPIKTGSVVNGKAQAYKPARRNTVAIGYNRSSAAGDLVLPSAVADSEFLFRIVFTSDKSLYAERPEGLPYQVNMTAGSTRLQLATEIARVINNSAFGSAEAGVKQIVAVVTTDGAAAYGVEVTGLDINQFQNTQYAEEFPAFDIFLDSQSAFGVTDYAKIQSASRGTGTYAQAYNAENFAYGALNRTKFPIPTLTYLASSAGTVLTTAITLAVTVGSDEATFSADISATGLEAGSIITINGVENEIKYIVAGSLTEVVLRDASLVLDADAVVTAKTFYNVISMSVTDQTRQDGAGVAQLSSKQIDLFIPAHDAGAMPAAASAEYTAVQDVIEDFFGGSLVAFEVA